MNKPSFPADREPSLFALLSEAGIRVTPVQLEQLERYTDLMTEKNKVLNLTRFATRGEFYVKHLLNSLLIATHVDCSHIKKAADIGTGGGLPGISLAILLPQVAFTLVDSVQKKIAAVREFAEQLGLKNVTALSERLEELGQKSGYREQFDLVTASALAPLPVLAELALPLVKVGGVLAAPKGPQYHEELGQSKNALHLLRANTPQVVHYLLPSEAGDRYLLVFHKTTPTPLTYPRRTGVPNSRPL